MNNPRIARALWLGLTILLSTFPLVSSNYWLRIVDYAIINAIMILGLNFIVGLAGQVSLGHAAFFGIGAYTSGLLTAQRAGELVWLGLPAAGLLAGLIALLVGMPTLRLKGHYLALATAGFGEIVKLVLVNWDKVTRGADGITNIPAPRLFGFEFATNVRMYYLLLLFAALMALVAHYLSRSSYGRAMQAVRQNELAAEAMGISPMRVKLLAFVLSAVYAGIAGSLYAHTSNYISPDHFGFDLTAMSMVGLLIGGAGTVSGPMIGALLITVLPEGFRAFKVAYMLIFGVVLMVLMGAMPEGVAGLLRRFRADPEEVKRVDGTAAD